MNVSCIISVAKRTQTTVAAIQPKLLCSQRSIEGLMGYMYVYACIYVCTEVCLTRVHIRRQQLLGTRQNAQFYDLNVYLSK